MRKGYSTRHGFVRQILSSNLDTKSTTCKQLSRLVGASAQSKGTLNIYVGGTTVGTFGDLAVSNGVALGGTLMIKLVNGFVLRHGGSILEVCRNRYLYDAPL